MWLLWVDEDKINISDVMPFKMPLCFKIQLQVMRTTEFIPCFICTLEPQYKNCEAKLHFSI